MNIPLNEFEQHLPEEVLSRGLSYFQNQQIEEPEQVEVGVYETIAHGTEDYLVRVKIKDNTLTSATCTCPYEYGEVCKHIAGLLFHLQQDELELQPKKKAKEETQKKPRKKGGRKTLAEQVVELLQRVPEGELKQFVEEYSQQDRAFRRLLLARFATHSGKKTKAFFSRQVKGIISVAKDSYGFIPLQQAHFVGNAVAELLSAAEQQLREGELKTAFYISAAVLEEMTKALEIGDDSSGDIGGNCYRARDLLLDVGQAELPDSLRKEMLKYALKVHGKGIFGSWDWDSDMLWLAATLCRTQEEAKQVQAFLDEPVNFRFDEGDVLTIRLELIRQVEGEKAANQFMKKHLNNPAVREQAIAQAFSAKDYERAAELAKAGIEQDESSPALIQDWEKWLLLIGLEQEDLDTVVPHARKLFLHEFNHDLDYYSILKEHVPQEEWPQFVEDLIREIQEEGQWYILAYIPIIYVQEEYWERLLEYLQEQTKQKSIDLNGLKEFEKYLVPQYQEEFAKLYEERVLFDLEMSAGRAAYRKACRFLKRMKKLGAGERVAEIVRDLRKTYPTRTALQDELDKV